MQSVERIADVVVVGGGLAGCSAALQLARNGYRVLLVEKKCYPAPKLCGEFLSTEVQALLRRLNLERAVMEAGAQPIREVRITTPEGPSFQSVLPGTGLGLSRYVLDGLLFEAARRAGVRVMEGTSVQSIEGTFKEGFAVETTAGMLEARIVLGAYGKRSSLDRKLGRTFLQTPSPFVAFKAHYEGITLPGCIELHSFPGGYCGLSEVEGGRVNACWIAEDAVLKASRGDPEVMIEQVFARNAFLAERFRALHRVSERFLAVSQVSFMPRGVFAGDVCMIGDTAGMIGPMCGDGMAMALRSAEAVVPLVSAYLERQLAHHSFKGSYERRWHREFGLRMRLGRWMHHGFSHPPAARLGVHACRRLPGLGRWLIRKTRGANDPSEAPRHAAI